MPRFDALRAAASHATTMQTICREAHVSPGALYVYFDSKEALIAGLCERDRAEFAERFAALATAPDFLGALREIGEHYFLEEAARSSASSSRWASRRRAIRASPKFS